VAPGGVHSPVRSFKGLDRAPLFFNKAEGPYLYAVEGHRYVDFCQSFGPLILGHLDPEVKEGVQSMVETAWTFGACDVYSLELAEWLRDQIPWLEKLRFVSSGTEAVMSALRVARAATGRSKVLKFEGCYHGHTDTLLVQAGSGLAGVAASSSAGVPQAMADLTLVAPLDNESRLMEILELHQHELAAVIIEPLPANYGLLIQRKEFLMKLASLCKKHQILLIFDEVISGFRVGLQGMAGLLGIIPDLVTYGKIIGGGFPVGCYGGRQDLMDQVAPLGPVYQAGTLSANPIGMKAGLLTLKKMVRLDGYAILEKRSQIFAAQIRKGLEEKGASLTLDQFASLFWLRGTGTDRRDPAEGVGDALSFGRARTPLRSIEQIPKDQGALFKQIFIQCLENKIYLAPNAYEVGFISMAHDESLLEECAHKILSCLPQQ